jgi:hypothetical protein
MYFSWREPQEPHMQVTINIPDAVLREAIEAQVGAAVAKITSEVIHAKANEIIDKKMERFDPEAIARAFVTSQMTETVRAQMSTELLALLGPQGYQRRQKVEELVMQVAKQLLRGEVGGKA